MKKILLSTILFGFVAIGAQAQENKTATNPKMPPRPPAEYLKDKEMPSFKILETDSVTIYNTSSVGKGKTVIIFFDPGCSHCIMFLEKLFPAMDSFKKVNFIFTSMVHDMSKLKKFKEDYHLDSYKNVKMIGKDQEMFFITHYGLQRFPGAVVYDQHKKFVGFYESDEVTVDALYKATH